MRVYREERTLDRPPEAVASAALGDPARRRRTARVLGIYRTETTLDAADGSVRTVVEVPGVAACVAAAVAVAAVGVVSPAVRLAALWVCVLAVVAPLGHLLPGVDERPGVCRVVERRVTPATAPAYLAAIGLLWLTLSPPLGRGATLFCAALLVVGAGCYAVGAGWRTASVSALWLPAAGLLPAVSTAGALAVASALARSTSPALAVAAGVAVAAVSLAVVAAYSYLVCRSLRSARFEPLASTRSRGALLAGYLLVVAVLVALAADLAVAVAGEFGPTVAAVLCAPLLLPVGGWLYHAAGTVTARLDAVRRARWRTVDGVRLFVLDVDAPLVRAVSLPRGVVVSRRVLEALTDEELAAVLAHERHHLDGSNRLLGATVGCASVLVGRNPLAAFLDHPARERAADRRAVEAAGREPLVRALRRLEGLGRRSPSAPGLAAAPHALLYGPVADAAVHPSVDERIAALSRAG